MKKYQTTADVEARYGRTPQQAVGIARESVERVPLTTNQHILHLLLTVFTAGAWLPVWVYFIVRGVPAQPY